jgi:hypothetical protein
MQNIMSGSDVSDEVPIVTVEFTKVVPTHVCRVDCPVWEPRVGMNIGVYLFGRMTEIISVADQCPSDLPDTMSGSVGFGNPVMAVALRTKIVVVAFETVDSWFLRTNRAHASVAAPSISILCVIYYCRYRRDNRLRTSGSVT